MMAPVIPITPARILLGLTLVLLVAGCGRSRPAPVEYRQGAAAITQAEERPAPVESAHIVAEGETIYVVARRYRASIRELVVLNRLTAPYRLQAGQHLRLPVPRFHQVAPGDTVYSISRRYRTDVRSLVRANAIAPPYTIQVGQRLRLPAGQRVAGGARPETPKPESKPGRSSRPVAVMPASKPDRVGSRRGASAALPKPPPRTAERFAWPVRGRLLSGYGAKRDGLHNDGINIAAVRGAPVKAAESGVVVYVGNELRGFGNLLLVRHSGGWMTAYAHTDEVVVKPGQTVRRGQLVARVGSSGSVSRPQLHFEIRKGRSAVDPTRYLVST